MLNCVTSVTVRTGRSRRGGRRALLPKLLAPDKAAQRNDWQVTIPGVLSWLATGSFSGQVIGLRAFPPQDQPPLLPLIFYAFRIMAGIGFALFFLMVWTGWAALTGRLRTATISGLRMLLWAWVAATIGSPQACATTNAVPKSCPSARCALPHRWKAHCQRSTQDSRKAPCRHRAATDNSEHVGPHVQQWNWVIAALAVWRRKNDRFARDIEASVAIARVEIAEPF
jgi:Cytochrome bd terminal oxidase subunit I